MIIWQSGHSSDEGSLLQLEGSQRPWHSRGEAAIDAAHNAKAATDSRGMGIAATSGAEPRGQQQPHRQLLIAPLGEVASPVRAAPSQSQALLAQPLAEGPRGFVSPLQQRLGLPWPPGHGMGLGRFQAPLQYQASCSPIQLGARLTRPRLAVAGTCTGWWGRQGEGGVSQTGNCFAVAQPTRQLLQAMQTYGLPRGGEC